MVMMTKAGVITTCKETIRTAYCGGAGPPCGKGRGAKSNAMWREKEKKCWARPGVAVKKTEFILLVLNILINTKSTD